MHIPCAKIHKRAAMLDWDSLRYFLEVARTQRVSAAARKLGVEHTTVARRVRALEAELDSLLFEKSRSAGYVLTEDGQRLFVFAEQMESTVHTARENLSGIGQALSGHVRIGATEGFGSYVLTPLAADFQRRYPHITLDILPVPRFVSLSKREADLAITIERPQRGPYVCTKLCDYTLMLYGTPAYLARHAPIRERADLAGHNFIGYVDELLFSERLRYLEDVLPNSQVVLRSTSVIAQYHAALQGQSLAILPCFIAAQDPRLTPVLPDDIAITRSFWMYCHEDLRRLKRVSALWEFMRRSVMRNAALLQGRGAALQYLP
ncbi:LysR substrate-binding domain protein [Bordetella bronchiseptica 980-2]|nr:LysR substrate-binding domain protein [Bordetella bronchiseptica 980-2]KCV52252.1 LysR substrate-binding domain protein [Bordetella bronchiseptica 3E44]KDB65430.1 LysR substrate-binding domain protein [Bordetella bronchiseptica B18-5 (C3)]KDB65732.1 LysR substrate-binding domain protein [Bordetella bronchiseptica A1-7]KDB70432.1 LysR substrate-binding domain protein [Bordetella bronchiseptica B20-10725633]KDB81395.1 LysR substrate-binding domain protein [Bordetella bronchiseptica CARE970018